MNQNEYPINEELVIAGVEGTGIPKPENQQNTDDITPARFLRWPSFEHMGQVLYYDERHKGGAPVVDHPFNDPVYSNGSVLIAGDNYGTGSSREHAPQALRRAGVQAIIAKDFAGIFDENCANVGIVAVRARGIDVDGLVEQVRADPGTIVGISLENDAVSYGSPESGYWKFPISINDGTKQSFMNGWWDAIPLLLQNEVKVEEKKADLDYLAFK